jgi:hypothetical protein
MIATGAGAPPERASEQGKHLALRKRRDSNPEWFPTARFQGPLDPRTLALVCKSEVQRRSVTSAGFAPGVVLAASWTAPGGSTLEHLDAGPGPFDLAVTSAAGRRAGVGVEHVVGLMRSVRSMTLVEDEEALHRSAPRPGDLRRLLLTLWVLRGPGAPAGSGAARPSAQEGCARPVWAGLKTYRKFSQPRPSAAGGHRGSSDGVMLWSLGIDPTSKRSDDVVVVESSRVCSS